MKVELSLVFPDPKHVVIQSQLGSTQSLQFENPLTADSLRNIRWYLEVYSTQYMTDIDDKRAKGIEQLFSEWGDALFKATIGLPQAQSTFQQFYEKKGRVLTIGASHPDILSLPWELLHIPGGDFLFNSNPQISVRRQLNKICNSSQRNYHPKKKVCLLFIVSRPSDAGFIDSRSDAKAVMKALQKEGRERVEIEFLRPATIDALEQRLNNQLLPEVDIIHFDGHGIYDADGRLATEANHSSIFDLTENSVNEGKNVGYLLFENERGKRALVSADKLSDILNGKKIALIVLSACQSAMTATDALGSVAASLTYVGIPAVLAMTYSVLVDSTRELFGEFYRSLVLGYGVSEATDNARRHLYQHPDRGERQRGRSKISLTLQDWFLPVLYQARSDIPLLQKIAEYEVISRSDSNVISSFGNLPGLQEAGFHGRSQELWQIERAFVNGVRRISIVGFGGQGKTFLAQEAGRWLCQTGMFKKVCFIDYVGFQSVGAVELLISTLGTVLNQSFVDVQAAKVSLEQIPTLLVLSNLQALSTKVQETLFDVVHDWSHTGCTRFLLTNHQPDINSSQYLIKHSHEHVYLPLHGLGSEQYPADALAYFEAMMLLSPTPTVPKPNEADLVNLFKMVDFHPLSISLLAQQLKERRPSDLGSRLEQLLVEESNSLTASLQLALDRLGAEEKNWLPKLGVFQDGAFEGLLMLVTGLELTTEMRRGLNFLRLLAEQPQGGTELTQEDELPPEKYQQLSQLFQVAQENPEAIAEMIAPFNAVDTDKEVDGLDWSVLRQSLVECGLLLVEQVPNVDEAFLKVHPAIAPLLWPKLTDAEQSELRRRHRQQYYQMSARLYVLDRQHPESARAIARRELPNLMMAVKGTLSASEPYAAKFVSLFTHFLYVLGLNKDQQNIGEMLKKINSETDSRSRYLSRCNYGESLRVVGRYVEAENVFLEVLTELEDTPSYNLCHTLDMLGRCLAAQGKAAEAMKCYQKGLSLATQIEQDDSIEMLQATISINLANIFLLLREDDKAKLLCDTAMHIAQERGDVRTIAVVNGLLSTILENKDRIQEAIALRQTTLRNFQQLGEPVMEAYSLWQLGELYRSNEQWDEAEQYYRKAAQMRDDQGDIAGVARTWVVLAKVNRDAGRIDAAISYYEKSLEQIELLPLRGSSQLYELAYILQNQKDSDNNFSCLPAAQRYAEEALSIKKALEDPIVTEIWNTYHLLAEIAEKQNRLVDTNNYRQQARQAKLACGADKSELQRWAPLVIDAVFAAEGDYLARERLFPLLKKYERSEYSNQIFAVQRIIAGERNEDTLTNFLDPEDSMVVTSILKGLADSSSLEPWLNENSVVDYRYRKGFKFVLYQAMIMLVRRLFSFPQQH